MGKQSILLQQQQRLDDALSGLFAKIEHISDEDKNVKPASDKWSINQVLSHLFQSEKGTYGYITYKIKTRENIKPAGIWSWIRITGLKIAHSLPIKYKAPKVTANVPETLDFQALKKEWLLLRENYRELAATFPEELLGKNIFNHPILGRLHIEHAFEFLINHMHRHYRQLDELVKYIEEKR